MDYASVIADLYERHRSVRDAGFSGDAYKPGLDAMLSYAEYLGHPERKFRTIHVAGTNGKGSVCSMLAAALAARGLRVGLYTSPHLVDFRERIKIISGPGAPLPQRELRFAHPSQPLGWAPPSNVSEGGHGSSEAGARPVSEMILEEAVCWFMNRYDREGLTFFEVTTGMAFWWFAASGVDVAVIETGLGGRLDSTNIIKPVISVITSIGLDHCDLLGSTRAKIAAEKAGIFKRGVPALVWGRDRETRPVFNRVAKAVGAPLYFAEDYLLPSDQETVLERSDRGGVGGTAPRPLGVQGDSSLKGRAFTLDLTGPCQDLNLRTVFAALNILGLDCPEAREGIAHAAAITGLRGRWEQLLSDPLTICDIGHNPPAMEANCKRLEALNRPLIIVYGAMKDKDVDGIKQYLPEGAEYYLVQPDTPRAMPLKDLALKLKNLNPVAAGSVPEGVRQALDRARQLPGATVYIGGSTFVVSEAITYVESL